MSGHKGQVVGYVRVSAADQNEARQVAAIGEVDRTFVDKASGKNTEREQLKVMLAYVRTGDIVRVKSPDRLARSTRDLLALIESLHHAEVDVEFVDNPGLSTNSPQGAFMLTILGAVAELERATIRERQAEGIALARKRGVYDRKPKLTPEQVDDARHRVQALHVPVSRVAKQFGVSRQTLYSALNGVGPYADVTAS